MRLRGARETPLFSALCPEAAGERVVTQDGDIALYRGWLGADRADAVLASIRATTVWIRERRKMYDRFVDVPREQAWFGDDRQHAFTPELASVRRDIERATHARFAYVLLNRYRDGNDGVAWHCDREVEGLQSPVIGSLTLGVTRAFDLRPKSDRRRVISIDLDHGDLLVMRGETQRYWEHRVRKEPRIGGERVNLTFRQQPD
ncbi:MAG: alpha-ketoglutarate-dependent dioxygenase AlkB [Candidatus Eremiobacteraeota bacterium]|nr:alpha-ketoglutarate-dependent dioxygenase AlkB [Candidatus Eremiobacteraeota bacterium]